MSRITPELCDLLGIRYPILQGGMGPFATPKLAAAVSNAGGLGTISSAGADIGPERARAAFETHIGTVSRQTDNNFAVNVPIGTAETPSHVTETVAAYLNTVFEVKRADDEVGDRLIAVITSAGNPARWNDEIAEAGLLHVHKVANVKHAKKAESIGVDVVIASGYEMGGHTHVEEEAVHSFVLIPEVTDAVDVPVVASGGVKNGKHLLAALAMGAQGVSMGTRLMQTRESDFTDAWKEYVSEASEGSDTIVSGLLSPSLRVLETEGARELKAAGHLERSDYLELEKEKLQLAIGGDIEEGILPAGQIAGYIDDLPTVETLIRDVVDETLDRYDRLPIR